MPLPLPLIFRTPIEHLIIIFDSFAMLFTVFRLMYRARAKQLWWDDFWAFLALINITLLFAGYIHASLDPFKIHGQPWIVSYPMVVVSTYLALWCSRLSIAVTVVRVIATGKSLLVSKIMAAIFGVLGFVTISAKLIICNPPGFDYSCDGNSVITGYIDLATSFFADFWLLLAPAYLLKRMRLGKQFHRILQAIFATEILVLIISIIHCVYTYKKDFEAVGVVSYFKVAISLIVCNLLFLVTYLYRHLRNDQEQTSQGEPTTAPSIKIWSGDIYTAITRFTSRITTNLFRSTVPESESQSGIMGSRPALFESEPGIVIREWSTGSDLCRINTV